jgi:hypothetical protein
LASTSLPTKMSNSPFRTLTCWMGWDTPPNTQSFSPIQTSCQTREALCPSRHSKYTYKCNLQRLMTTILTSTIKKTFRLKTLPNGTPDMIKFTKIYQSSSTTIHMLQ